MSAETTHITSARDLVTSRVANRALHFPDLDLTALQSSDLDQRDGALARAIDQAVARRWLTLVAVIESRLNRPWESIQPDLQATLLVGAAQLLLLDKLPDHAVINEAVEWAKRHVRTKAGGLVNAVLRKVASLRGAGSDEGASRVSSASRNGRKFSQSFGRNQLPRDDGRVVRLTEDIFDSDPLIRHAQQTSHPPEVLRQWERTFGRERAFDFAIHNLTVAPTIVTGAEAENDFNDHACDGFKLFNGDHDRLLNLLDANPAARVQDPASAAPVVATGGLDPQLIIDACAGLGTKTRQLAALHPHAQIVASDSDQRRLESLNQLCAAGAYAERVTVVEPGALSQYAGRADLLVLDVPCSNSGVLARRVEAKYRMSEQSIDDLVSIQRQIIADTLALLADQGRLLYCTCSLEPRENQQQIEMILQHHPFQFEHERLTLPAGRPGDAPRHYHDGGYYALLQRK